MNRDALGRIDEVRANNQLLADNVGYLPFGPMTSLTYGNGLNATNDFDQDYRLASQSIGNVFSQTYGYDLVNNITTITDTLTPANDQTFVYDALDRLETADGNYGSLSYTYDPVGNRTSETNPTGTNTYSYDTTSQQLDSITGNTNSSLSYDANGNLITQDNATYTYSDLNRLAQATANGQTTDYLYNGRGERTVKTDPSNTTLYHYDQSGLLLSETDEQGNSIRDYVYLNGQRLAILDDTGTYYIHSNHLDTPQVITDQNQTVVWQATYTPFGEANITTASIENNLRFPGQYFDQETNLHYNYFRDYNPRLGRYTTSDPIGLDGGINTYSYAFQNPIRFVDLFGLNPTLTVVTVDRRVADLGPRIPGGIVDSAVDIFVEVIINCECGGSDTNDLSFSIGLGLGEEVLLTQSFSFTAPDAESQADNALMNFTAEIAALDARDFCE